MTKSLSGTTGKSGDIGEGFMTEDTDSADFDSVEEAAPVRPVQKDPAIRRKIEDRLERKRLRDELGIFDDEAWEDI
jgi:hypothetical protein